MLLALTRVASTHSVSIGLGDDYYIIDGTDDVIIENANAGINSVDYRRMMAAEPERTSLAIVW